MKRLLSAQASEILAMNKDELKQSIKASEGRTILTEMTVYGSLLGNITNGEVAAAFGSDMILLNGIDLFHPVIPGLPETDKPIQLLAQLTGRPVGANLEPVDDSITLMSDKVEIAEGRKASVETFKQADKLGLQFICLTGNPGTGVTNKTIANAIKLCKENYSGLIIAGKMHASGVDEPVVDIPTIKEFIKAGADIILMPAAGTVPGLQESEITEACKIIKEAGCLSLSAIGTSQETSDTNTIRELALSAKRSGIDIQHIGDAGWGGMALPENIMEMSIAIRGVRHTYFKMAQSVRR